MHAGEYHRLSRLHRCRFLARRRLRGYPCSLPMNMDATDETQPDRGRCHFHPCWTNLNTALSPRHAWRAKVRRPKCSPLQFPIFPLVCGPRVERDLIFSLSRTIKMRISSALAYIRLGISPPYSANFLGLSATLDAFSPAVPRGRRRSSFPNYEPRKPETKSRRVNDPLARESVEHANENVTSRLAHIFSR